MAGNTLMSLLVKLGVSSGDFDKGMAAAENRAKSTAGSIGGTLSSIGSGMATIGKVALGAALAVGAAGAAGIGVMVKEGIEMNKFLELSTLQFTTLMGSADKAREHVKMLFKVAATTPFEASEIINASKAMLTLGGAALDTEANLRMVGDAAAATGAPVGEVAMWVGRAYNAIQSGRPWGEAAMRLQELGIVGGDARIALEKLQASGASGPEVWAAFQKSLGKFSGAMELQANTWEGLMSTIKDNVKMVLGTAFKPLFDVFKTGLKRITEFTSGEGFTKWMEGVGRVAGIASRILENLFSGNLSGAIAVFMDSLRGIVPQSVLVDIWKLKDRFMKVFDLFKSGDVSAAFTELGGAVGQGISVLVGMFSGWVASIDWGKVATDLSNFLFTALGTMTVNLINWINGTDWGAVSDGIINGIAGIGKGSEKTVNAGNILIESLFNATAAAAAAIDWGMITLTIFDQIHAALNEDAQQGDLIAAWDVGIIGWTNFFAGVKGQWDTFKAEWDVSMAGWTAFGDGFAAKWAEGIAGWGNFFAGVKAKWDEFKTAWDVGMAGWTSFGDGISATIDKVIEAMGRMASALMNVVLPDWLTPGSPTPFEMGLRGINDALKTVASTGLPTMQAQFSTTSEQGSAGGAGAMGGGIDYEEMGRVIARAMTSALARSEFA